MSSRGLVCHPGSGVEAQVHHEISEKSKCLIKQISRICGMCRHKPAGLHASTAMCQDHATFVVGNQLATNQRGCLRQGNRDQPAGDQGMELASVGLGIRVGQRAIREQARLARDQRTGTASARSGNGIG